MPKPPHQRKNTGTKDRRLDDEAGVIRRFVRALQGWMRRPVGIYRWEGRWRIGFKERRLAPPDALAVRDMLTDLQQRLLAQPPEHAAEVLRHLVQLHDELRLKGWAGVQALPPSVRSKAMFQAQMLARESPSRPIHQLIERLMGPKPTQADRAAAVAASARVAQADGEALLRAQGAPADIPVEVSEASQEEFDASQRGWLDTIPPIQPRYMTPEPEDAPSSSPQK